MQALTAPAAAVLLAVAQSLAPAPDQSISSWCEGRLIIPPESGSPRPGPLSFEGIEHLREPLDRLHPDDPATRVSVIGGAQSGKSTIGQSWTGWKIVNSPRPMAIGLPSIAEVLKYNRMKLQCVVDATPELKHRVRAVSSRDEQGSTSTYKRLTGGGYIQLFPLSSPKELQMISAGDLILEEVANTGKEVGSRGAPIKQARERQAAFSVIGSKELMVSTPGMLGECPVTEAYELGDQRRFYGRCVHCEGRFCLEPDGFTPAGATFGHHFACPGCGGLTEESHGPAWRDDGRGWVPTFVSREPDANPQPPKFIAAADLARWQARDCEGRQPSYYTWQAMCGLISWSKIAETIAEAKTPGDLIALEQQVYGRAYDPSIEALSWEELHRLREDYPGAAVPSGYGVLSGFCDVQGAYLEWGVLAWGPGAEWAVVDRGIVEGDTAGDEVWGRLDEVVRRRYPHADGGELPIAAFGVDTGFRSNRVYQFVHGRPNCWAMDGRPGWTAPLIGKPKPVRVVRGGRVVGRVRLWPTGTWPLKSLLAWSLKTSIEAGYAVRQQGRGHWSKVEDEAWCQQITAETLHEEKNPKTGDMDRWWKVISGRRNEWVDIWVGCRALAWQLGVGAPPRGLRAAGRNPGGEAFDWATAAQARALAPPQTDLFVQTAAPGLAADASAPTPNTDDPKPEKQWFKRSS